jgi:hypothetical protein
VNQEITNDIAVRAANEDLALQNQQHYLDKATATNTRRAYQAAIRQFEATGGLLPATEQDIARYITNKAPLLNPRTLSLHLTAISHWHCYQHLPDPTQAAQIRKLLKGIYRRCRSRELQKCFTCGRQPLPDAVFSKTRFLAQK